MKIWDKLGFIAEIKSAKAQRQPVQVQPFLKSWKEAYIRTTLVIILARMEKKVRPALSLSVVPPGSEGLRNLDDPKEAGN